MRRRWGVWVVVLSTLFVLGPALTHPTSRVVGSPSVDGYGTQWFFWFAAEVLAGRATPAFTDHLFYPWGKDLYTHTGGNLLDAWLAAPLRAALGPVAGFDVWILVVLLSNAWGGARLAAAFGVPVGMRWIAALALVLNPYVLAEIDLGRPTQAWLAPMALCLAAFVRVKHGGWTDAVVGGLWMAATALAYWYYGLVVAALAVLLAGWRVVTGPDRAPALARYALAAGIAAAGALPFALPMLDTLGAGAVPGLLALDGDGPLAPLALRTVEGDEQGVYVVAPLHAAAGSLLDDGGLRFVPGLAAMGWVHLLVAAVGLCVLVAEDRRRWGWVLPGLAITLFIASGPVLVVGESLIVSRPFVTLYAEVDLLRRWWWPGRAIGGFHVLLAPLAAVVLARVGGRPRWVVGGAMLIGVLVPLRRDALLPIAAWEAEVPATLACLAAAPPGAVIDVPLLVDQKNLWYGTVHGKPLLGGMLLKKPAFAPEEFRALRETDPLIAALDVVGERQYTRRLTTATPEARAALAALGYRYVLARIDAFRHSRADRDGAITWVSDWSRPRRQLVTLLGEPAAEDAALAVWTIDGGAMGCGP